MSIIIAKEGTKAAKIDNIEFTKEGYLQEYHPSEPRLNSSLRYSGR